jgi:2-polyprenyl-3-methyl-5-hydroxy-6-metoxy-1,4-benzoquinol methylase
MNFTHRSYEKELLDNDNIPFADIVSTMRELNVINRLLGGHSITRKGINFFLGKTNPETPLTIAEIGCGGGDNLTAIKRHFKKTGRSVRLTGVDTKKECITYSRQYAAPDITWICSDYRNVVWPDKKPDIIFSSLFCHHFTDEELVGQLSWLKKNSNFGFFINDLHRHYLAYYSIALLTRLFSKSHLVKNDAPLSVSRAFKRRDWKKLLHAAGITQYEIKWEWAFRYLICAENEQ